jgi:hypothetical protein
MTTRVFVVGVFSVASRRRDVIGIEIGGWTDVEDQSGAKGG